MRLKPVSYTHLDVYKRQAHPDVRIVLHEYHSNTLAGLVREDKIDFALMNIPNKIDGFVYQIV